MSNYSHSDLVIDAIRTRQNNSRVKKISEAITITSAFHFSGVDKADIEKSIDKLKSFKVGTFKNISTKVTSDTCSLFLAAIWNRELFLNKIFLQKFQNLQR